VQAGVEAGAAAHGSNAASTSAGMKPANDTSKDTTCTYANANTCTASGGRGGSAAATAQASAKSDASKRYGNGKTAAQIAASRGVQAGATIDGPGNSQPHKVACPGSTHAPDVHAFKGGSNACAAAVVKTATQVTTTTTSTPIKASTTPAATTATPTTTTTATTMTATTAATTATTVAPAGEVEGETSPVGTGKRNDHGRGGVAAATSNVGNGTLPFTGFPLWLAGLVALLLIGGGLALRSRAAASRS
jgi:hypothetical protein